MLLPSVGPGVIAVSGDAWSAAPAWSGPAAAPLPPAVDWSDGGSCRGGRGGAGGSDGSGQCSRYGRVLARGAAVEPGLVSPGVCPPPAGRPTNYPFHIVTRLALLTPSCFVRRAGTTSRCPRDRDATGTAAEESATDERFIEPASRPPLGPARGGRRRLP